MDRGEVGGRSWGLVVSPDETVRRMLMPWRESPDPGMRIERIPSFVWASIG